MSKRMLINAIDPEECRVAVVVEDRIEELYIDRPTTESYLGNIYKGRVVSVEPSIQAAFVDFGQGKNGFLHVSDVMPAYGRADTNGGGNHERNGEDEDDEDEDRWSRRTRRDIQSLIHKGQEVLVQISKDPIGTKVPTLTTYISIPGRYVVLMPSISKRGVSKKIEDDRERRKLRRLLDEIDPPLGMGYIVRTAGAHRSKGDLVRDINYLLNLWRSIARRAKSEPGPCAIYQESDLVIRTIRDIFTKDIEEVITDDEATFRRAKSFMEEVLPTYAERVVLYDNPRPLFSCYRIEDQIERIYDRIVSLQSGGSIIIDQAEALVAIDVNSGKFKEKNNLEETAFRTNVEAAHEIVRQLRLRDLGGVVVCDFIDMREGRHRRAIENLVQDLLRYDRARTRVSQMSQFCMLELTRQRVRPSLENTAHQLCHECGGTGLIKTAQSMAMKLIRQVRLRVAEMVQTTERKPIEVVANPAVASFLMEAKQPALRDIDSRYGVAVTVRADGRYKVEEAKFS